MEYLEGKPIIDDLESMTKDLGEIQTLMKSMLEGLLYLERQNIVHKDLKPYNILFKKNGDFASAKILDFGLAADINDKYNLNKISGTPGFIAPEVFLSLEEKIELPLSSKIDIFSLGVIFHCLLFGDFLFEGDDSNAIYEKNEKGEFQIGSIKGMREGLEDPLALDLLKKMLKEIQKIEPQLKKHLNMTS